MLCPEPEIAEVLTSIRLSAQIKMDAKTIDSKEVFTDEK